MRRKEKTNIALKNIYLISVLVIIATLTFIFNAFAIMLSEDGSLDTPVFSDPTITVSQTTTPADIFPSLAIDTTYTQDLNNNFSTFLDKINQIENVATNSHWLPEDRLAIQNDITNQVTDFVNQLYVLRDRVLQDITSVNKDLELQNRLPVEILRSEGINPAETAQELKGKSIVLSTALEEVNAEIKQLETQFGIKPPEKETVDTPIEEGQSLQCLLSDLKVENQEQFDSFFKDLSTFSQDIYPLLGTLLRNQFQTAVREKISFYQQNLQGVDRNTPAGSQVYDIINGYIGKLNQYLNTLSAVPEAAHELFLNNEFSNFDSMVKWSNRLKDYLDKNYANMSPEERSNVMDMLFESQNTLSQWKNGICPQTISETISKLKGWKGKLLFSHILSGLKGFTPPDWRKSVMDYFSQTLATLNARSAEIDNLSVSLQELSDYYKKITSSVITQEDKIQLNTAGTPPPSPKDETRIITIYGKINGMAQDIQTTLDSLTMPAMNHFLPEDYVEIASAKLNNIKKGLKQLQSLYSELTQFGQFDTIVTLIQNLSIQTTALENRITYVRGTILYQYGTPAPSPQGDITSPVPPKTENPPAAGTTPTPQGGTPSPTPPQETESPAATGTAPVTISVQGGTSGTQTPPSNPRTDVTTSQSDAKLQDTSNGKGTTLQNRGIIILPRTDTALSQTGNLPPIQLSNETVPINPLQLGHKDTNLSNPMIQTQGGDSTAMPLTQDESEALAKSFKTSFDNLDSKLRSTMADLYPDLYSGLTNSGTVANTLASVFSSPPVNPGNANNFQDKQTIVLTMLGRISLGENYSENPVLSGAVYEVTQQILNSYNNTLRDILPGQFTNIIQRVFQSGDNFDIQKFSKKTGISEDFISQIVELAKNSPEIFSHLQLNTDNISAPIGYVAIDGEKGFITFTANNKIHPYNIEKFKKLLDPNNENNENKIAALAKSVNISEDVLRQIRDNISHRNKGVFVIITVDVDGKKVPVLVLSDTIVYINSTKPTEVAKEILKHILINRPNASEALVNRAFLLIVIIGLICIGFGIGLAVYITRLQLKKYNYFNPAFKHGKAYQHHFAPSWKTR